MAISELMAHSNVQVVVTAADLREFAMAILEEAEKTRLEKKEELFTPSAFCQRHGISKPTLWRWAKAGILHPVRKGGKVFYKDSDLMEKGGEE